MSLTFSSALFMRPVTSSISSDSFIELRITISTELLTASRMQLHNAACVILPSSCRLHFYDAPRIARSATTFGPKDVKFWHRQQVVIRNVQFPLQFLLNLLIFEALLWIFFSIRQEVKKDAYLSLNFAPLQKNEPKTTVTECEDTENHKTIEQNKNYYSS